MTTSDRPPWAHPLALFHPAVAAWFAQRFAAPTEPQLRAWPCIRRGEAVLVAAPTGSGKTLAAFLAAIDDLVRRGLEAPLPDETFVVYVSPLKALSNDVQKNLALPLDGIREELARRGEPEVGIRTLVRTGDTSDAERAGMRKRPPHIVVTTPESLYILLGSESGRRMLATTRTVIVDEIHALAGNKRGSHLTLTLERLAALAGRPLVRIGLSATQQPIEAVARFLVGERAPCTIIDSGHMRTRDLAIELPGAPLAAVMSTDVWKLLYARLADLIGGRRTTLVFVNTRRLAERVTRHLAELLGEANVAAHHGSMAKERRLDAEQRLKRGKLKALVATASLELGIDIGDVDLVCQIGSPRSIGTFLQRAGRASHQVGGVPTAKVFPLSRDELVECIALLEAVRRGELDRIVIPPGPLDVLAQQIVAEVAAEEWREDALFALVRRAQPYAALARDDFDDVLDLLAEGFTTRHGHRAAYLHRDRVNGLLRARRGARLTALTSGGAIPDTADYEVILEPANQLVGTLNEDFAVESIAGDVFQLGNTSYRILRVEGGRVRVEDAHGLPPSIPFWIGEAPGRTDALSIAVARLREAVAAGLAAGGQDRACAWLVGEVGIGAAAAREAVQYLAAGRAALGVLPTRKTVVLERFFDESGGMQLVIHSPFGSRINRAWGLALRKRFCVKFNFELQAAATEDAIVLSLSTSHSFRLADVAKYLNARTVRHVLVQAAIASPMFIARWRWAAGISLALPRFRGGKKVPAPLQRMRAEDLVAAVFPDQIACAENLTGERQIPDHPLVRQAIADCLEEAMDIAGLEALLRDIESGAIAVVACDLAGPSPLAAEILTARPYAFLDDAPLEERRTQAVMGRRWLDEASAADLGRLDAAAIDRVRTEAWPDPTDADELHDALLGLGVATPGEVEQGRWGEWLATLVGEGRAVAVHLPHDGDGGKSAAGERPAFWIAVERWPRVLVAYPAAIPRPAVQGTVVRRQKPVTREEALADLVRGRLEAAGPITPGVLADVLRLSPGDVDAALARLVAAGVAMEGRFTGAASIEWCDRALLARIHRYTMQRLRQEVEPVAGRDFMRFLLHWQRVTSAARGEGRDALAAVIDQLQGFEAPASAWESELLPARIDGYDREDLDALCRTGQAAWMRLTPPVGGVRPGAPGPVRSTPVALLPRPAAATWAHWSSRSAARHREETEPVAVGAAESPLLGGRAELVRGLLREHGASFLDELVELSGLLRAEVEDALGELVAAGEVTCDSFAGLRSLITPSGKRRHHGRIGLRDSGRWTLVRRTPLRQAHAGQRSEPGGDPLPPLVWALLRRYGVVFWRVLQREAAWLPPWRDMVRELRRLEARGEIRGGRFVAGISGEQFALPEAVGLLRAMRRAPRTGAFVAVSAVDPLNQLGLLLPGGKVPAIATNRVLFRDGLPVGALVGGEVQWLETLEPEVLGTARDLLVRSAGSRSTLRSPRAPKRPSGARLVAAWHGIG